MISWSQIARGAFRRFVPAVLLMDAVLSLPTWITHGIGPSPLAVFTGIASAVLGYATILGILRSHLRTDAEVEGRRSVVAGVASIGLIAAGAATFRIGSPSLVTSMTRLGALYFGSGFLVTAGLYFPWISTHKSALRSAELNGAPPVPADVRVPFISTLDNRDRVS